MQEDNIYDKATVKAITAEKLEEIEGTRIPFLNIEECQLKEIQIKIHCHMLIRIIKIIEAE